MASMIVKRPNSANPWTPGGFAAWAEHYPETAWQPVTAEQDLSRDFISQWTSDAPMNPATVGTVVLTPGLFSEFLPNCFGAAIRTLGSAGFRVVRTRARSRYGIQNQVQRIVAQLQQALEPGEQFIWCGHSKGAIEMLYALETAPSLRASCVAAVALQPAAGVSLVVERWQNRPKNFAERMGGALLGSPPVREGVREISRSRDPEVFRWLGDFEPVVPTVCAVTWSIHPTSWVDSYHRTLNEIAPGHAHDGQFLLVDQRLPGTRLVCLPELDHAQPVFGGNHLDTERFWRALVSVALQVANASRSARAQTR